MINLLSLLSRLSHPKKNGRGNYVKGLQQQQQQQQQQQREDEDQHLQHDQEQASSVAMQLPALAIFTGSQLQLGRLLGEGATGRVLQGTWLRQPAAIKLLSTRGWLPAASFMWEAKVYLKLQQLQGSCLHPQASPGCLATATSAADVQQGAWPRGRRGAPEALRRLRRGALVQQRLPAGAAAAAQGTVPEGQRCQAGHEGGEAGHAAGQ
jgi:hypothetical protein